jgi:hypothetical protein
MGLEAMFCRVLRFKNEAGANFPVAYSAGTAIINHKLALATRFTCNYNTQQPSSD